MPLTAGVACVCRPSCSSQNSSSRCRNTSHTVSMKMSFQLLQSHSWGSSSDTLGRDDLMQAFNTKGIGFIMRFCWEGYRIPQCLTSSRNYGGSSSSVERALCDLGGAKLVGSGSRWLDLRYYAIKTPLPRETCRPGSCSVPAKPHE